MGLSLWRRAGAADTRRCAAQLPQPPPPAGVLAQREEGVHRARPHQCAPAHICPQFGLALYSGHIRQQVAACIAPTRGTSTGESGCSSNLSECGVACGRPADDGPLRGADAVASVASARQLGSAAASCAQEEEGPAAEGPQEDVPPVPVVQIAHRTSQMMCQAARLVARVPPNTHLAGRARDLEMPLHVTHNGQR